MASADSALASLVDLTKGTIADIKAIATGTWDVSTAELCDSNLERLVDSAANLELGPLQDPALDLYAYFGVFAEGALVPSQAQKLELSRLCAELKRGLAEAVPAVAATTLAPVYGLRTELQPPTELVEQFAQEGYRLQWFDDGDGFAAAVRLELPKAVLADTSLIQSIGETLDVVADNDPESTHVPLVALSAKQNTESRLQALVGGADLYVAKIDDRRLARKVNELIRTESQAPFRVLIADDDRSIAELCAHILRRSGMQIRQILEADQVVEAVTEFRPDLVLMDLYMPGQDGVSLTMELRERADAAVLPIVFLSGEKSEDARFQAIQAGGDDFLTKPIRPRHLVAAVRSRIKRARVLSRQISTQPSAREVSSSGQVRRGQFLSSLSDAHARPASDGVTVLCALAVDQAESLDADMGLAAKHDLEQALAQRLMRACAEQDLLCLWQEFGFGLLLRDCPRSRVGELTERMRAAVGAQPIKIHNQDTKLSISIGIAPQPRSGTGGVDLWIASAFSALGTAQRLGGNRVEGMLSDDDELPPEKVLWLRELLKIAATGIGVGTEFQPLVPLRGHDPGHYALLQYLRDRRQPLGGVSRSEYLRVARDLKVVPQIERIGLFRAFEALDDQRSRNRAADVLVPLDLASVDRSLMNWLDGELKRRRYQGQSMSVEFDAEILLERPALLGIVKQLRQSGVKTLVSDRSGQLQRLQQFRKMPIDGVRMPVGTLLAAPIELVNQMIEDWRQPGKILIADGVDEVSLLASLWNLGVDYLQGNAVATSGPRLDFDFSEING